MKLINIIIALAYIILSLIFALNNNCDTIASYMLGVVGGSQLIFLLENLIAIITTKKNLNYGTQN